MTAPNVVARVDALISLGRSAEAIAMVSTALAADPNSAILLCQLARAQLLAKQPELAREAASRAVALDPESEWCFRILSQCYGDLGDHWNAVKAAGEAQRLAPDEWRTHVRRALASAQAKHLSDAWAAAQEAVRLAPDEPDAHFAMGFAAKANNDLATAEQAYLHTLALSPNHASALNNLGGIRLKQRGGLQRAARGFSAALAVDAQLDVARRNLDVLARRYLRRFHFGVVIAYVILIVSLGSHTSGATDQVSGASRVYAGLLGGVAMVLLLGAIVVVHRQLPKNLQPYYRRLPRTDLLLGAWLAVDLFALGVIAALAVPTTYTGRSQLSDLAWALIVVGVVMSWLPRLRQQVSGGRRG